MSELIFSCMLFFCFVWVWGANNCTLHWGVWFWLLFWFGLFFCCILRVGRWVGSHSHVGCYVGDCGCSGAYAKVFCGTHVLGHVCRIMHCRFFGQKPSLKNFFLRSYFVLSLESFLVKKRSKLGKKLSWFIVLFPLGFCVVLRVLWGLPVGLWVCSCMLGLIRRGRRCSILLVFCIRRRFLGIRRVRICL